MELGVINTERLKRGSAILLACVAIGPLVSCGGCKNDTDCDGIANSIDRSPDVKDPEDVDNDGFPNATDDDPYVNIFRPPASSPSVTATPDSTPAPIPTPTVTATPRPNYRSDCTLGLKPDSDGDGTPDVCDTHFDPYAKDSDNDDIPDARDDYPYNPDENNNGTDDGHDRDYDQTSPNNTDPNN